MATFALVHGAWHGAWCWEPLAAELSARGHHCIAGDLPCEDPELGAAAYRDRILGWLDREAGRGYDDPPVVVGHSLAGLTIPLVAEARPVRRLVFLCALVPQPGRSWAEIAGEEGDVHPAGWGPGENGYVMLDGGRLSWWPPERALRGMYPDVGPELAAAAAHRLRVQSRKVHTEVSPLRAWPNVPCSYLLGTRDAAVNPVWSRRVARRRLGIEPVELDAGHSPFLTQPAQLAEVLCGLV